MENKGKEKSSSRNDISLDQAILQWIVDDYDISDEKSRKIVGKSEEKSKLITCEMVMNYLDNRGVLEETDETEFMRSLRKRLYDIVKLLDERIALQLEELDFEIREEGNKTNLYKMHDEYKIDLEMLSKDVN